MTQPRPLPFDVDAGVLPADVRDALERFGAEAPTLLVLAGPRARESGWAPRAAIAIASALRDAGHPTLLVDLELEAPGLHKQLEVANVEGLADVFSFGTSPRHVMQPVSGRGFRFLAPGAYIPDAGAVMRDPQWARVLAESAADDQALLIYARAENVNLDPLLGRIGHVVLLAEEEESRRIFSLLRDRAELIALLVPHVEEPAPGSEDPAAARTPASWSRAGVGTAAAAAEFDAPWTERIPLDKLLTEPPVMRRREPSRWTVKRALILFSISLVLGTLAYFAWLASQRYLVRQQIETGPPITAADSAAAANLADSLAADSIAGDSIAPSDTAGGVRPLPYSVAIEAHRELAAATARADDLRRAEPALSFFVAPIRIEKDIFYRVMAGPAEDTTDARVLMARLVARGHKTAVEPWAVRRTRLAFDLGAFAAASEARERVSALAEQGIPAYIVEGTTDDARFRVYAGAYEGPGEAVVLREALKRAGITARLVTRTGRPAA